MTVSYQSHLAHSTSGGFARLLFKWRGSLYKLIYKEVLTFLVLYAAISAIYRNVFDEYYQGKFEKIVLYCEALEKMIPLSFILGFYVTYIISRWWTQYQTIPWPDKILHLLTLYISGNDEHDQMMLRSLMRYVNLSLILVLRSISSSVKRRFPTLQHLVDAGLMTTEELELYEAVPNSDITTYWIPSTWFMQLLKDGCKQKRFHDIHAVVYIAKEFDYFRSKCDLLWSFDWISIPLLYTQVVTLMTYGYFLIALIGRQYIETSSKTALNKGHLQTELDKYVSLFTVLQFLFFMGLLKVAEQLINPFGDDEEDFELNWLIDRHTKVSYLGIDMVMKNKCPSLVKDKHWNIENFSLPYDDSVIDLKKKTHHGSVTHMKFPADKHGAISNNSAASNANNEPTITYFDV